MIKATFKPLPGLSGPEITIHISAVPQKDAIVSVRADNGEIINGYARHIHWSYNPDGECVEISVNTVGYPQKALE